MLFIAMGLIVALVATDLLDLTHRTADRKNARGFGAASGPNRTRMIGPK